MLKQSICMAFALSALQAGAVCNDFLNASAPADRFVVEEATAVDLHTGLRWARCAAGYDWAGGACIRNTQLAESFDWQSALQYSTAATYAGEAGWRLPNKNELDSLVERKCEQPAINSEVFPGTDSVNFWTNSMVPHNVGRAWSINFGRGDHNTTTRDTELGVRLVKDVQP